MKRFLLFSCLGHALLIALLWPLSHFLEQSITGSMSNKRAGLRIAAGNVTFWWTLKGLPQQTNIRYRTELLEWSTLTEYRNLGQFGYFTQVLRPPWGERHVVRLPIWILLVVSLAWPFKKAVATWKHRQTSR